MCSALHWRRVARRMIFSCWPRARRNAFRDNGVCPTAPFPETRRPASFVVRQTYFVNQLRRCRMSVFLSPAVRAFGLTMAFAAVVGAQGAQKACEVNESRPTQV